MKTVVAIMAPILLLFAHAPVCAGGAFGLEMGMPIEQIDGDALELRPGWYRVMSVPKPHPAFAFYVVKMCPVHGLSQVQAVCADPQSSSYESEVVSMFRDMRSELEKR